MKKEYIPLIGFNEGESKLARYCPFWLARIISFKFFAKKMRLHQTDWYKSVDINTDDIRIIKRK